MEAEVKRDLCDLCNLLAGYISAEKTPISINLDLLFQTFNAYIKANSLSGLEDLSNLICTLKGHKKNSIKLDCKMDHCVYCYNELAQNDLWEPNIATCTHRTPIPPVVRNRIIKEYTRLQNLIRTCGLCRENKDRMDFATLSSHDCIVCTSCMRNIFKAEDKENKCPMCQQVLKDECEITIRSLVEAEMSPEALEKIYSKECPRCKELQDSRVFQQICFEQCIACSSCIKEIKDRGLEKCAQGHPVTIINA